MWILKIVNTSTSEAPRRRPDGAEPNPAGRCPAAPEFPPTSGRGSDEREQQHRTSSGGAGDSLQEEGRALQQKTTPVSDRDLDIVFKMRYLRGKSF